MELQITDQRLLQLAADSRIQRGAPIFARLRGATRRRGCGKCKKKRNNNSQVQLLQSIKRSIVGSSAMRDLIKRVTGAKSLAVHLRVGTRVVKRVV
jgi:hypothetical protein